MIKFDYKPQTDPQGPFVVFSIAGKFGTDWVVWRVRDKVVVKQGDLTTMLRWVKTWGPMND